MNEKKSKLRNILNFSVMIAMTVAVIGMIGFSIYSFWPHKKVVEASCDSAKETPQTDNTQLGYTSDHYQAKLRQLLTNSDTKVVLASSKEKSDQISPIVGDGDKIVHSNVDTSSGSVVYTSVKAGVSEMPLGWEFNIAKAKLSTPTDYVVSFRYKSNVPADIGVTYRDGQKVTPGDTLARLDVSSDWTEKTMHIRIDKVGLIPALTLSSDSVGTMSIKDATVGQLPSRDLGRGLVTLAFDDGWESIYSTGRPLFSKYNLPTTQFIVSDFSFGDVASPDYMNIDQIRQMQKEGHEIASHSFAHCDAVRQDDDKLADSITRSQTQFKQALGRAPQLYAHPFGSYDGRVNKSLSTDFDFIRSSDEGLNNAYFDPHNIHIMSVEATTTDEQIKSWIDQAASKHQWLILLYHRIGESGEYNISSDKLDSQLRIISTKPGIDVVTASTAIARINALK